MKRIIVFLSISLVIISYSYGGFPHESAWAHSDLGPYEDGGDIVTYNWDDHYGTFRINADAYSTGSGMGGSGYAQATTELFNGTTSIHYLSAWSQDGENDPNCKYIYDVTANKAILYVKAWTWEPATAVISYADAKVTWW